MIRFFIAAIVASVLLWTGTLLHDSFEPHHIALEVHDHRGETTSAPAIGVEEHWHGPFCTAQGSASKLMSAIQPVPGRIVSIQDVFFNLIAPAYVQEFLGRPPPDLPHFAQIPRQILLSVMLI